MNPRQRSGVSTIVTDPDFNDSRSFPRLVARRLEGRVLRSDAAGLSKGLGQGSVQQLPCDGPDRHRRLGPIGRPTARSSPITTLTAPSWPRTPTGRIRPRSRVPASARSSATAPPGPRTVRRSSAWSDGDERRWLEPGTGAERFRRRPRPGSRPHRRLRAPQGRHAGARAARALLPALPVAQPHARRRAAIRVVQPASPFSSLTLGTPDANGAAANSTASARFDVCPVAGCAAPEVSAW